MLMGFKHGAVMVSQGHLAEGTTGLNHGGHARSSVPNPFDIVGMGGLSKSQRLHHSE